MWTACPARNLSLLAVLVFGGCSDRADKPKVWEDFSGEKAYEHVRRLVSFGPRPAGSRSLEDSRGYIMAQLSEAGWEVERQAFTAETTRGRIEFVNLIARHKSLDKSRAQPSWLLASHYDTKLLDGIHFVGANDAGSSTGLLLEFARVIGSSAGLAAKVQLVFFDGEEAFETFSDTDGLYGSRYFAKQLASLDRTKDFRGAIVFDMVGDKSLRITLPPDSPVELARGIFASADALKLRNYFTYFDRQITDDHTPLNAVGIPTIDIIDFDFVQWHTAGDNIESISAESLRIVGTVALHFLSQTASK